MDWYIYIVVIAIGVIVGFINTLAGGGSILSLPLLIFLGLPANVANGTNRIGVLLQSIVATGSFKKYKIINLKDGLLYAIPSVIGAIIGAFIAVDINEAILKKTIAFILIIMLFTIFLNPNKWKKKELKINPKPSFLQIIVFFLMGVYGGFIQIGAGFFYISAFILTTGINLIRANALKVLIISLYTIFALIIFIINDQVNYELGLLLGLGNIFGALIATKSAIKGGENFVKIIIVVTIIASVIKLLL